jgi:hypothetical protein
MKKLTPSNKDDHRSMSLWHRYEDFSNRHPCLTELLMLIPIVGICTIADFMDNAHITAACGVSLGTCILFYWICETTSVPFFPFNDVVVPPPLLRWRDCRGLGVIISLAFYWTERVGKEYGELTIIPTWSIPIVYWAVFLVGCIGTHYVVRRRYVKCDNVLEKLSLLKRSRRNCGNAVWCFIVGGIGIYSITTFGSVNIDVIVLALYCLPIALILFWVLDIIIALIGHWCGLR